MIDTHAHFYDELFLNNWDNSVDEIQQAGIKEIWLPNCDSESFRDLKMIWDKNQDLFKAMVGLHPTYVKENYKEELAFVHNQLASNQNILAIGEIGLDYYWDTTFQIEQIEAFETQCHWAMENHLWVDIHCRKAYADLIKIIRKKEFKDLIGIVHCFSGDAAEAKHCVENGFFLGIGGVITYKNSTLFNDIKDIPLDYLVLETDAPYLTPVPHRGTPNSPKYIPLIVRKIAELYQVSEEVVIEKTTKNASLLKAFSNVQ